MLTFLLVTRNGALQAKLAKYSVYEKFLMKVLDQLPEGTVAIYFLIVLLHDELLFLTLFESIFIH